MREVRAVDAMERMMMLNRHLEGIRRDGFVMTRQIDPYTVEIRELQVRASPPNHVLHAILTLFTCFLWAVVWIVVSWDYSRDQRRVEREPYMAGTWRVHITELGEIDTEPS
jgi:hypothetical protein